MDFSTGLILSLAAIAAILTIIKGLDKLDQRKVANAIADLG